MASEQPARESKATDGEVHVEKDRVPNMASHFEHLAVKAQESGITQSKDNPHEDNRARNRAGGGTQSDEARGRLVSGEGWKKEEVSSKEENKGLTEGERGEEGHERPSLEDIGEYRMSAQQKSADAIRAAEERYNKAKESLQHPEDRAQSQRDSDVSREKGQEATETAVEGAQRASEMVRNKVILAKEMAMERGQQAKESIVHGAHGVAEQAREKGAKAKDTAVEKGQQAKESVVQGAQTAANYAGDKAAEAKEATVEGGKGAVHYAGMVANKAAAVGWSATHYTTEKAVQGTKAVAGAVEGIAEGAVHKAAEIGSKVVGATKEKAAAAAETVVGYTARKKEEAQEGYEAKR